MSEHSGSLFGVAFAVCGQEKTTAEEPRSVLALGGTCSVAEGERGGVGWDGVKATADAGMSPKHPAICILQLFDANVKESRQSNVTFLNNSR